MKTILHVYAEQSYDWSEGHRSSFNQEQLSWTIKRVGMASSNLFTRIATRPVWQSRLFRGGSQSYIGTMLLDE